MYFALYLNILLNYFGLIQASPEPEGEPDTDTRLDDQSDPAQEEVRDKRKDAELSDYNDDKDILNVS